LSIGEHRCQFFDLKKPFGSLTAKSMQICWIEALLGIAHFGPACAHHSDHIFVFLVIHECMLKPHGVAQLVCIEATEKVEVGKDRKY
jgi:hypothetical protein